MMVRSAPLAAVAATAAIVLLAVAANGETVFDHDKIVSCYYSSWAYYRPGIGMFDVDDIDPDMCTHGFYGFADLNNVTWEIDAIDINFDLGPEDCPEGEVCQYSGFRRFTGIRDASSHFVPMLSIGGWNAGSGEYSLMANDPEARATFVASVGPYLTKYGFMGLDIDWEYPGMRAGANIDVDMENFVTLSKELYEAFQEYDPPLLLTAAIPAGYQNIDAGMDVVGFEPYYDFLNVMAYDYHGWFPPDHEFTGHNSPLRGYTVEDNEDHPGYLFHVQSTIEKYIGLGMPPEKMVMGVPTYGRGFQINNTEESGMFCPAYTGFPMGPYTRQMGHYGYLEVLQLYTNDTNLFMPDAVPLAWEYVWDECYKSPYLRNGRYWLGFDDPDSSAVKTAYANFMGLGGIMVWSIETDDFGGFYSETTYPLMRRINQVLASGEEFDPATDYEYCEDLSTICDILSGLVEACERNAQQLPYPGDCHKYYYCIDTGEDDENGDDVYETEVFTCGDYVFDPISENCIYPNDQGVENLCGGRVD